MIKNLHSSWRSCCTVMRLGPSELVSAVHDYGACLVDSRPFHQNGFVHAQISNNQAL